MNERTDEPGIPFGKNPRLVLLAWKLLMKAHIKAKCQCRDEGKKEDTKIINTTIKGYNFELSECRFS